jgi:hypothetical protein
MKRVREVEGAIDRDRDREYADGWGRKKRYEIEPDGNGKEWGKFEMYSQKEEAI